MEYLKEKNISYDSRYFTVRLANQTLKVRVICLLKMIQRLFADHSHWNDEYGHRCLECLNTDLCVKQVEKKTQYILLKRKSEELLYSFASKTSTEVLSSWILQSTNQSHQRDSHRNESIWKLSLEKKKKESARTNILVNWKLFASPFGLNPFPEIEY